MTSLPIKHSEAFGDCLFIDNSTLEYLDTCPRSFEYHYLDKRQSAEERSALNFGGAMHAGLAVRYAAPSDMQDFVAGTALEQEQFAAMDAYFEQHPVELGGFRQPALARQLIEGYNKKFQVEPFSVIENQGKPMVEFPFAFKLCTMAYNEPHTSGNAKLITWFYMGRIDLVVAEESQEFTMDHKTTSMMGNGFWMEQRVSPQHEGYCWAWERATGRCPAGYIVNGIRTRAPLKRDENGQSKRSSRKDVEEDDFQRDKVFIDTRRLSEWKDNLCAKLETFLWYYSRGYFPQHKKWCVGKYGPCQYYDVCTLPVEFRETTLFSGAFKDVDWSPLTEKTSDEVKPQADQPYPIDWENLMKENS